jgi:hypothetical protein
MNNPDHISESLETIFWVKILKFFVADPGWKKFGSVIWDKHPGSATLPLATNNPLVNPTIFIAMRSNYLVLRRRSKCIFYFVFLLIL